jgi:hypothetical protein
MRVSLSGAFTDRTLAVNDGKVLQAANALSMRMTTGEPAR